MQVEHFGPSTIPKNQSRMINASAVHDYNNLQTNGTYSTAGLISLHFMSRNELVLFLSTGTTPERPARTDRSALPFGNIGGSRMGSEDVAVVGPPADEEDGAAEEETDYGYEDPVASHLR